MFKPADLFDLSQTEHATISTAATSPGTRSRKLNPISPRNLKPELRNTCEGRAFIGEKVFIGAGTVVEDGVMIKGPAIIGKNCQIRHNAYLRENVIIGDGCVVGNSSELKTRCCSTARRCRTSITSATPSSATRRTSARA